MSKFIDQAVNNSKDETIADRAAKTQPILKANLTALMFAQKSVVMETRSALVELEEEAEKAVGYVTKDAEAYFHNLTNAETRRDQAAEDLKEAEALEEKLQEMIDKNFS